MKPWLEERQTGAAAIQTNFLRPYHGHAGIIRLRTSALQLIARTEVTQDMNTLAEEIGARLLERGEFVATAESCTGGLIAKLMTDIAGSSGWFERGVITYSNLAKQELLDVPEDIIADTGAVSDTTAQCMVEGLLMSSPADWGIAVTGVAGPTGGTKAKPVGTVWIAWLHRGGDPVVRCHHFDGNREQVREQTANTAMAELLKFLRND